MSGDKLFDAQLELAARLRVTCRYGFELCDALTVLHQAVLRGEPCDASAREVSRCVGDLLGEQFSRALLGEP